MFNKAILASITIPSMTQEKEPISDTDRAFWLNKATREMCKIFGGVTATNGVGGWVDSEGVLHQEDVTVLQSYCMAEPQHIGARREDLVHLATALRNALDQHCVMVVFGDEVAFI